MKAEYKSAVRSRRLLRNAFFALAEEKDIRKITVTELIRRADVNRGTFYAHYDDMQDFLLSVMEEYTAGVYVILEELDEIDLFQSPLPIFQRLSEAFAANMDFYRMLHRSDQLNLFTKQLKDTFVKKIRSNPSVSSEVMQSAEFQSRLYFFSGGITELYRAWLTGILAETPEEIANTANEILENSSLFFKRTDSASNK